MDQSLHHRIRVRAYEMWNAAGRTDGLADQHWLAAERELLTEMTARTSAVETDASHRRHRRVRSDNGRQRKRIAKAS